MSDAHQYGALQGNARSARVLPYPCRPLERLAEVIAGREYVDAEYFSTPDQLEHISEVVAAQQEFCKMTGLFDAVVSPRILSTFRHNRAMASVADFHKHLQYSLRQQISCKWAADRCSGAVAPFLLLGSQYQSRVLAQ